MPDEEPQLDHLVSAGLVGEIRRITYKTQMTVGFSPLVMGVEISALGLESAMAQAREGMGYRREMSHGTIGGQSRGKISLGVVEESDRTSSSHKNSKRQEERTVLVNEHEKP